jgi:hypothetical protein
MQIIGKKKGTSENRRKMGRVSRRKNHSEISPLTKCSEGRVYSILESRYQLNSGMSKEQSTASKASYVMVVP